MRRPACHASAARRPRAGFTLVELLVVITIIAVLVGLTMPAINAAREQGRQVVCRGNLQQIGTAVRVFNDTNGFIPGWENVAGSGSASWVARITPQMERPDVWTQSISGGVPNVYISSFVCPTSPPDTQQSAWLSYAGIASGTGARRFLGVMVDGFPPPLPSSPNFFVSLEDVSAPAGGDGQTTTLLVVENCGRRRTSTARWDQLGEVKFDLPTGPPSPVINPLTPSPTTANSSHAGGALAVFCDTHVAFLPESLSAGNYAQLSSWRHGDASYGSGWNPPLVLNVDLK